ncbi:MAG: hypothetical protein AB1499_04650 [Nitrospirota bacterium]
MCTLADITYVNKDHGVCGITSSICANYKRTPVFRQAVDQSANGFNFVVDKLSAFLDRIDGTAHVNEIQKFTREFQGYQNFSMSTWKQSVTSSYLSVLDGASGKIMKGMAMTPNATAALLYSWGLAPKLYNTGWGAGDNAKNKLVGLGRDNTGSHNGLKHWVYFDESEMAWNQGNHESYTTISSKYPVVACYIIF